MSFDNEVFNRLDREAIRRALEESRDQLKQISSDNRIVPRACEYGPYEPNPTDITPVADAIRDAQSEAVDRFYEQQRSQDEARWEAAQNARELVSAKHSAMSQRNEHHHEMRNIHIGIGLIAYRRMAEARKQSHDQIEAIDRVGDKVDELGDVIDAASEANVRAQETQGDLNRRNADSNADRTVDAIHENTEMHAEIAERSIDALYDVAGLLMAQMERGSRIVEDAVRRLGRDIVGAIVTPCWNKADEKFRQAVEHEKYGRYQSALRELGKALKSDSTHSGANVLMGQIGFRLGETMFAREFFRRGMDYAPRCRRPGDYVRATLCLAELELLVGNTETSLRILAHAQKHAPRGWDVREIREYPVQAYAFVWEGIRLKEMFWMEILFRETKGFLARYPYLWERMLETPIGEAIVGEFPLIRFRNGAYAALAWMLYEFQGFGLDLEDKAFHARMLSDLRKVDAGMTLYEPWYHECLLEIQRLEFRAGNSYGWCQNARRVWIDANARETARVVEQARLAEIARVEVERQEAEKAKVARIAQRNAMKKKIREDERQKVEAAMRFAEQARRAEAARIEDERLKADNRRREADRLEAKRLDDERKERERLEAECLEAKRVEAVRIAESKRQAELARVQAERAEAERLRQKKVEARAIAYRTRLREESLAYWQSFREAAVRSLRNFLISAFVVGIALTLATLAMLSVWMTSN